jgi:hypothetical protein
MPNNRFALGQGLYGAGEKYSSTTEYQTLIGEHAKFHRAAGDMIDKANSGKELNAELILNFSSEYGSASHHSTSLRAMFMRGQSARP